MYLAHGARVLAAGTLGLAMPAAGGARPAAATAARGRPGRQTGRGRGQRDHHPRGAAPAAGIRRRPLDHGRVRAVAPYRLLQPGAAPAGVRPERALLARDHRQGRHDRHRRALRLAHDRQRPARLRQRGERAQPAVAADHQARGQGPALQPRQRQHGRLGRRDHAGRGVRARDRARREDPAGRDAGRRRERDRQLAADPDGREVRDQAPPRRRDQPELRRHRAGRRIRPRSSRCAAPTRPPTPTTSRCWPPRATPARPASRPPAELLHPPRSRPGRPATRW